jgi:hypothetical protein
VIQVALMIKQARKHKKQAHYSNYGLCMNRAVMGYICKEIQKPYSVSKCNKFMKGIDRADKYLSYYSILRKTVKWPNVFAKSCTLQCVFVYKTLNTKKK